MLESFPACLLIGSALGFLSGLGVGGGSLLILWLTLVLGMDPTVSRGINLLFFIPSALIAACFRLRQGVIPLKKITPAMAAGCLSALAFSWLGTNLNTAVLKKLFGALLIFTGIRELFYQRKK